MDKIYAFFWFRCSFGFGYLWCKKQSYSTVSFYDKWYGKNRWSFSTFALYQLVRGKTNPLQMANIAVIIANKVGFIRLILLKTQLIKNKTGIDKKHFIPVITE